MVAHREPWCGKVVRVLPLDPQAAGKERDPGPGLGF